MNKRNDPAAGWRRRACRLILAALLALAGGARLAANHDFSEITRLAEGALVGEHVNDPIPGFEILVLRNGSPVYHRAFGRWQLNRVASIDSTTKTLTAAVLMSLTERGPQPFSLDSRLSDFLPAFRVAGKSEITIRQAFSHTSGMNAGVTFWPLFAGGLTLREAANFIAAEPLLYAPGTAFCYGSISMHAAGAAAEAAAGIPFVDLVAERITTPLQMTQTRFYIASQQNPRIDGGVESTAAEFSRFMDMLLLEGVDRPRGLRVLTIPSVRAMLTRQTSDLQPTLSSPIDNNRYGVGVWVDQLGQHGPSVPALAAGARGFHSWIEASHGVVFTFATDLSTRSNILELASLMHAEILRVIPTLADSISGSLNPTVFELSPTSSQGTFSGQYTGGYPFGRAHLQVSVELGPNANWKTLETQNLDGYGATSFVAVPFTIEDAPRNRAYFFRVGTEPAEPAF